MDPIPERSQLAASLYAHLAANPEVGDWKDRPGEWNLRQLAREAFRRADIFLEVAREQSA